MLLERAEGDRTSLILPVLLHFSHYYFAVNPTTV